MPFLYWRLHFYSCCVEFITSGDRVLVSNMTFMFKQEQLSMIVGRNHCGNFWYTPDTVGIVLRFKKSVCIQGLEMTILAEWARMFHTGHSTVFQAWFITSQKTRLSIFTITQKQGTTFYMEFFIQLGDMVLRKWIKNVLHWIKSVLYWRSFFHDPLPWKVCQLFQHCHI